MSSGNGNGKEGKLLNSLYSKESEENAREKDIKRNDMKETGKEKTERNTESKGTTHRKKESHEHRKLKEEIEKLKEENASLKDQLLRKQADFENFRKRMFREREEAIKYANSKLLLDLTAVIDDFERAIQSAETSRDFDSFLKGVSLIEKQMTNMLEKRWGLKRFTSLGETFDPEKHEAIATEESEDYEQPVVLEDYQKGYLLHDRLLRPAKVKVAKPVAVIDNTAPGEGGREEREDNEENKDKNN